MSLATDYAVQPAWLNRIAHRPFFRGLTEDLLRRSLRRLEERLRHNWHPDEDPRAAPPATTEKSGSGAPSGGSRSVSDRPDTPKKSVPTHPEAAFFGVCYGI